MTRFAFGDTNVFFRSPKFDRNRGSRWIHFCLSVCHTTLRMFSCLQINCQPFYLCQLLKFHPSDSLIEIYLETEDQGTRHKMVSLQPMPSFPLCSLHQHDNCSVLCDVNVSSKRSSVVTSCQPISK